MMQHVSVNVKTIVLFAVYVVFSSLGMVIIKKMGTDTAISMNKSGISGFVNWIYVLGIILYVSSFLCWIFVIKAFPLTYISPVAYGLVFIMIAVLSRLFLNEQISIKTVIGGIVIIIGVIIAST